MASSPVPPPRRAVRRSGHVPAPPTPSRRSYPAHRRGAPRRVARRSPLRHHRRQLRSPPGRPCRGPPGRRRRRHLRRRRRRTVKMSPAKEVGFMAAGRRQHRGGPHGCRGTRSRQPPPPRPARLPYRTDGRAGGGRPAARARPLPAGAAIRRSRGRRLRPDRARPHSQRLASPWDGRRRRPRPRRRGRRYHHQGQA